jgi:hypothetical protein
VEPDPSLFGCGTFGCHIRMGRQQNRQRIQEGDAAAVDTSRVNMHRQLVCLNLLAALPNLVSIGLDEQGFACRGTERESFTGLLFCHFAAAS